jgi:hypothetical protein
MILRGLTTSALLSALFGISACAPKITVLDRPTLMQEESVGKFPDLEGRFQQEGLQKGPLMLDRSKLGEKQAPEKALNVLGGELTRESASR